MDKILILDFGSQVTQLIAAACVKRTSYANCTRSTCRWKRIKSFGRKASSCPADRIRYTKRLPGRSWPVFELGVPVLGICYGMQWMAQTLGGKVEPGKRVNSAMPKSARAVIPNCWKGLQDRSNDAGHGLLDVWMSHGDKVTEMPTGFKLIASTPSCPVAAMADEALKVSTAYSSTRKSPTPKRHGNVHRFVLTSATAAIVDHAQLHVKKPSKSSRPGRQRKK